MFFSPAEVLMCPPLKKDLYECDGWAGDRFLKVSARLCITGLPPPPASENTHTVSAGDWVGDIIIVCIGVHLVVPRM